MSVILFVFSHLVCCINYGKKELKLENSKPSCLSSGTMTKQVSCEKIYSEGKMMQKLFLNNTREICGMKHILP